LSCWRNFTLYLAVPRRKFLFHKWRVVNCAEPSSLSASRSQGVEHEQHLTGRNKQKRYLDLQAKPFRDEYGLLNVRVEDSIESGVRGRAWGRDRGVGYPVLTGSLDRCTCSYIDIMGSTIEDHPICGGFSHFPYIHWHCRPALDQSKESIHLKITYHSPP
jgi:hypothetical protein